MKRAAFICFLVVILAGCPTDGEDGSSDLPVSLKLWEPGADGYVQFYTNDSQYCGYGFPKLYDNTNAAGTYQIECKKVSGNEGQLYGMIFAAPNDDNDRYYRIGITRHC
jgi:hypothetical protein